MLHQMGFDALRWVTRIRAGKRLECANPPYTFLIEAAGRVREQGVDLAGL
jgi:hypothetical protein